ncbi:MAG: ribosomal rna-processing 8 [Lasallia pustulata]|uniref:Ribosomal RNA-processing protein 8 n=1 Tax=Lasallia pustulata TaxID=136370 RepID=A0A5M8PYM9_9LECA|nr:MAG: ribosomal rna-processing 8 [Lasallia pustulata]
MFSVPGWSVPAESLRTQVQSTDQAVVKPANIVANGSGSELAKTSKKRKRGHAQPNGISITSENLADLWEKHIERKSIIRVTGQGATAGCQEGAKKKRRQSAGKGLAGDLKVPTGIGGNGLQDTEDGKSRFEKRKTLKEKRREKKALLQANGDLPPPRPAPQQPLDITSKDGSHKEREMKPEATSMLHLSKGSGEPTASGSIPPPKPPATTPISTLTPLQRTMRDKLTSARFRHLNQTLYSTPSSHSLSLFTQNPTFFNEYHEGFRRQVSVWPENPVESFVKDFRVRALVRAMESQKARFRQEKKPKAKKGLKEEQPETATETTAGLDPLPRTDGLCTVADLGCGDAHLAASLSADLKKLKLKILSYDLATPSPLITRADIKDLPLKEGGVDIAIFCLALMGTNWIEFVEEAWRILRWKGELWVAEIKSRFGRVGKGAKGRVEHSVGNRMKGKVDRKKRKADEELADEEIAIEEVDERRDLGRGAETDVAAFVEVLRKRGFVLKGEVDAENKMFVRMRFLKALTPIKGKCTPPKNDRGGDMWKAKERAKFVENDDDPSQDDEAKVLKPCVYKIR